MTTLPFLTPPAAISKRKCGNSASGVLELPVLGGLTVGESAVITELLAEEQSAFVKGAKISDVIAKAEGISLSEAFSIIEQSITGAELEQRADEIRTRHAEKIDEVARIYRTAGARNMEATVTALIRCRCDLPQWGLADTRTLHRALFNDVWQLAQDEQDAEDNPSAPATEEDLGKQPAAGGAARKRTGRASSGS